MSMKVNYWDMEKIANWNKMRFPKNYLTLQRRKVESEIDEFNNAKTRKEKLEEMADVYISFAGLSRFSKIGEFVCRLFERMPDYELLQNAVNTKMAINITRRFDKNMHHLPPVVIPQSKLDGIHNPKCIPDLEYITVKKIFNYWKKDECGNWHRVKEPYEFEVLKSEWYKGE